MVKDDYANLGYANDWKKVPQEVKTCRDLGHIVQSKIIGRCLTLFYCPKCKIMWKVDSGD